jgi:uncharacterized surface protein with fasciclin (FAS1) repeats
MKANWITPIGALAVAASLVTSQAVAGSSCGAGSSYSDSSYSHNAGNGHSQNSGKSYKRGGGDPTATEKSEAKPAEKKADPKDIVDTAVGAGKFNTLVAAVKAADLVSTLKGEGPFTVFAPTDEAFAKLPKGTVEDLLKPENKEKLKAILLYHVVAGKVTAADVVKIEKAKTVNGAEAKVTVDGDTVKIDGAKVVKTDIVTKNGVIHVIDAVILPPSK